MSYKGVGGLVVVDKTLNATRYTQLLAENLFESAESMGLTKKLFFNKITPHVIKLHIL